MIDTILAYLISFCIIATGVGWIVASKNSTIAALWIGIGVAAIAVGTLSVVNELHHRRGRR